MNRALLHNVIKTLLEKMSDQNKMLTNHDGSFSQIETDLLRKHCLELYEAIGQLHLLNINSKSINSIPEMPKVEDEPTENNQEEPKQEEDDIEEPVQEIIAHAEPIKEELEIFIEEDETIETQTEIIPEPELIEELPEDPKPRFIPVKKLLQEEMESAKTEEITVPEKTKVENIVPQFIPIEEKPAPVYVAPIQKVKEEKSVLDKISQEQKSKTIHDHISSKNEEKLLHDLFPNSKIATIPSAIDISKRFELQNNLFGGQSHAYSQAIKSLEEAGNKNLALDAFDTLAQKLNWDTDSELVKEFKSFVYRKY